MKKVVLGIGLLSILVLVGYLTLFADGPRAGNVEPGARDTAGERRSVSPRDARLAQDGPQEAEASTQLAQDTPASQPAERRAITEPADEVELVRIPGRLLIPAGAPLDETLTIVARRTKASYEDIALWDEEGLERYGLAKQLAGHHAPVAADGSFELSVEEGWTEAWVEVDGRYLYSAQEIKVALTERPESIELGCQLGAWVVGTLRAAAGVPAADRVVANADVRLLTGLDGMQWGGSMNMGRFLPRPARADANGVFELRHVVPGNGHLIRVVPERMAPQRIELQTVAGEKLELAVEAQAGALLAGKVTDEHGAPVDEARVTARATETEEGGFAFWGERLVVEKQVTTGQDGRFAIVGAPTGAIELSARRQHWAGEAELELELASGEDRSDLELELRRGDSISGIVRWADGSPVPGAEVGVRVDLEADPDADVRNSRRLRNRLVTTEADGRFELTGLAEGTYVVRASIEEGGQDYEATAQGVDQAADELELTLARAKALLGIVLDSQGAPIEAFVVNAVPQRTQDGGMGAFLGRISKVENPSGEFALTGWGPGTWELGVQADGFSSSKPREVQLPEALDEGPLEFRLLPQIRVAGRVLDLAGNPVGGATVNVKREMTQPFMGMGAGGEGHPCDVDGSFEIPGLDERSLTLVASAPGFAPSEPLTVELVRGGSHEDLVLHLLVGGTVEGVVYDTSAKSLEGRMVNLMRMSEGAGQTATTDASGSFRFDNVPAGKWQVMAIPTNMGSRGGDEDNEADFINQMKMESIEVIEGQIVEVILGQPPAHPVRVTGQVEVAGEPMPDATLMFIASGDSPFGSLKAASTDAEGGFEAELEEAGSYQVTIRVERRGSEFTSFVEIPRVDEHHLKLEIEVGAIEGRIFGPDGEPLAEVGVSLRREGPAPRSMSMGGGNGKETDADGRYRFEWVEEGTYTVAAGSRGGFGFGGSSRFGRQSRTGVQIDAGKTVSGVDFELTEPGALEGTVVDSGRSPLAGATVFVRGENGAWVSGVSTTMSDAEGKFELGGLSSGEYQVLARKDGLSSELSDPIRVRANETSEVEVRLEQGTILILEILDGDGDPLSGSVSVVGPDGSDWSQLVSIGDLQKAFESFSTSEYEFGPLPPGTYEVRAVLSDGREKSRKIKLTGRPERRVRERFRD